MTKALVWNMSINIDGGPKVTESYALDTQAYDYLNVTLNAGETDKEIMVQPGEKDKLMFLLIRSDHYGTDLSYGPTAGGTKVPLDSPHIFTGSGMIGLLAQSPITLYFTNELQEYGAKIPVNIEILVIRSALVR